MSEYPQQKCTGRVLVIANNDVGLYKFRREVLFSLLESSYQVTVALPEGEYVSKLIEGGCEFIDTPLDRRGTNPVEDLKLLSRYKAIIKKVKPDIVLTYTVKPNTYGGMAAASLGVKYIATVTGLGTAFEGGGLLKKTVVMLTRYGTRNAECIFFQNKSNMSAFEELNIGIRRVLVPGSGVNLEANRFEDYPETGGTKLLFVGRMMRDKGVYELVDAMRELRAAGEDITLDMLGDCDDDCGDMLKAASREGIVNWHGYTTAVHEFMRESHAVILPSYHEGMANVLLEAAASGRPVLASSIPGCEETFNEGVSGLGFKPGDVQELKNAILAFARLTPAERAAMGKAGRIKIENEFDRNKVIASYVEEIERALK